jgi:microcystin-dependent protein
MNSMIGEIRAFPYTYVPYGWLECMGQTVSVVEYQALYSIIGQTYGGSGTSTFNLPNFQGAGLLGIGTAQTGTRYVAAERIGTETETLYINKLPAHNHNLIGEKGAASSRTSAPGTNNLSYLTNIGYQRSTDPAPLAAMAYLDVSRVPVALHPNSLTNGSGDLNTTIASHENRSPFLAIRYCICVFEGEYPIRP